MKKDNTYNDEFLDALADKLLDKLLERCSQPEWHVRRSDDFVNNLSGIIAFKENEQERMLGEMSKLMTLMVMYVENLALGYEGSIVRLNTKYQQKRSHSLRKFKDFSDAEATIVGYLDGKGKRTGTLGKFIMQDDEGNEFGCPPGKGYTYKDLKNMLDNIGDYIGQRATFTFFERTKAGSYRHPLFKCLRNYE